MRKLKDIEKEFIDSYRSDDGQILYIKWCDVGEDNYYDYGEKLPKEFHIEPQYKYLLDDHRICLIECCDCEACGSW